MRVNWQRLAGWWLVFLLPCPQAFAAPDIIEQTRQAITQAVDFLAQAQQPDGSFLMYVCDDAALRKCRPHYSTPSVIHAPDSPIVGSIPTVVVLRGLLAIEDSRTDAIVEDAARWLEAQMDPEGLFGGFRMVQPWVGPQCVGEFRQLRWTAVNRSVLEALHRSLTPIMSHLATYQRPDGTFSYFAIPPSEAQAIARGGQAQAQFRERYRPLMQKVGGMMLRLMDLEYPVTNAEVFAYLVQHGHAPAALCDYLVGMAQFDQLPDNPVFAERSSALVWHAMGRAYHLGATCLEPAKTVLQPRLLRQQRPDGSWGNVTETALTTTSLLQFGYTGEALDRAIDFLLDRQRADGGWERVPFRSDLIDASDGQTPLRSVLVSDEASAGYVLEALGTYLKAQRLETL